MTSLNRSDDNDLLVALRPPAAARDPARDGATRRRSARARSPSASTSRSATSATTSGCSPTARAIALVSTKPVRGSMQHFYRSRDRGALGAPGARPASRRTAARAGESSGRARDLAARDGHGRERRQLDARGRRRRHRVRRPAAGARPPPGPGDRRRTGPRGRRRVSRASPSATRSNAPSATSSASACCTATASSCCRPAPRCASTSCWTADRSRRNRARSRRSSSAAAAAAGRVLVGAARDQDHLGRGEAPELVLDRLDQVLVADPGLGAIPALASEATVITSRAGPRGGRPRRRRPSDRGSRSAPAPGPAPRPAGAVGARGHGGDLGDRRRVLERRGDDDQQAAAAAPRRAAPIAPAWALADRDDDDRRPPTRAPTATPTPGPPT